MSLTVRVASPSDAPLILQFIRDLAEYERLLHEVQATEADVRRDLFGENPRAFCDIAEHDGEPVGFALWFYNYSTFQGRAGIYLEDLFVEPGARGAGAGKALLRRLAQRCVEADLGRLEWAVLNWNAPSIAFYDSLGASAKEDWTVRRLDGAALANLAAE
ncbi:GNAT family N-acetyltransferase [Phenylobacterium hankyongense]|uniref:GNAT family N-acetyltransferase n=1 Tax=Phenylobacterium hankyongense TaxID=1813876 RepID=A0A328B2H6_9CAUL|nr:GNAT family N-acetyltransferase [Phenylobacterium hankyongense]RAK60116.1 GNAT family N-acetyltransferase [Phenylobacterium hankyongense]